jgi:hypothetical protein
LGVSLTEDVAPVAARITQLVECWFNEPVVEGSTPSLGMISMDVFFAKVGIEGVSNAFLFPLMLASFVDEFL